jgi:hypothetical protein
MRLPSFTRPVAGARTAFIGAAVAAFLVGISTVPSEASVSGAIFTTGVGCTGTNVNVFAAKDEVFIDGGPGKQGSAGLTDGSYFVKVTQPDGTLLGYSLTAVAHVTNGEFDQCYQLSAIVVSATDGITPGFDTTGNVDGVYKVWVSTDPSFPNSSSKTDNFKVLPGTCVGAQCELGTLTACKFYDFSLTDGAGEATDGIWQHATESGIQNWLMILSSNGTTLSTQLTDGSGCTSFTNLADGQYTVTEGTPNESNWFHTSSASLDRTIAGGDEFQLEFGNVCTGAGGGKTLGFWSNKNGAKQFATNLAGSLALLDGLNLRDGAGNNFEPSTYAQYKTWDLGGTAVNMAYMLSVQLAAMELNVFNGFVTGNTTRI